VSGGQALRRLAAVPRVTTKGQVTIPVTVRYALGIAPGDVVVFAVEDGRGVFRRAEGALAHEGRLGGESVVDADPLERFLRGGDDDFARAVEAGRDGGPRVDVRDEVVLALLEDALAEAPPAERTLLAEVFRDVVAEPGLRVEHARALTAAVDAAAAAEPVRPAYEAARA
jgi:AbrB family looped-hinge helix DNA binding protein